MRQQIHVHTIIQVVCCTKRKVKKESENNNNFNNIKLLFFTQVSYYRSGLMKLLNAILINLDKLTSFLRLSSNSIVHVFG